ncbi:hypothetical protein D3C79_873380 [compost metagenome]
MAYHCYHCATLRSFRCCDGFERSWRTAGDLAIEDLNPLVPLVSIGCEVGTSSEIAADTLTVPHVADGHVFDLDAAARTGDPIAIDATLFVWIVVYLVPATAFCSLSHDRVPLSDDSLSPEILRRSTALGRERGSYLALRSIAGFGWRRRHSGC